MRKKVLISLVIVCALLIGTLIFLVVKEVYKSDLFKTPPKPEITYGEFPFKLEYELNGEKHIIEDVWVCEFDGFGSNEGFGKQRKWKGKVKGTGKDKIVLLDVKEPTTLGLFGDTPIKQIIYFSPGSARYYMGDMIGVAGIYKNTFPDALYWEYSFPFTTCKGIVEKKELQERFNLRLTNWEIEPPIKNTFK